MGWVLWNHKHPTNLFFTYGTNPCTGNALYDPSCHGYAEALLQQQYDQNCIANPLYDGGVRICYCLS